MPPKHKICDDYPIAKSAKVINDQLQVKLTDGRTLSVPLSQFKQLKLAPADARKVVRPIFGGTGIDWPNLRFELGVGGLVRQCQTTKGCFITQASKRQRKA